jgi:hypothetical protein
MTILVDLSQVMHASIAGHLGFGGTDDLEEDLVRHIILNQLRGINVMFRQDYGRMVLCCDHPKTWRREAFPYYKAMRAKTRQDSGLDWKLIKKVMAEMVVDLQEHFPYRVVQVEGAEGDDVIAVLSRYAEGPVMIVSGDHDFIQLQQGDGFFGGNVVQQYDWVGKRSLDHTDPAGYKLEAIIKGDSGDGVPNIMMHGSCFVDGVRQKPMTKPRLEKFMAELPKGIGEENLLENYKRNVMLIDLDQTPQPIVENIRKVYDSEAGKNKSKVLNYFIAKRLSRLAMEISHF